MALGDGNFSHVQFSRNRITNPGLPVVYRDEIVTPTTSREQVLWVGGGGVSELPGIQEQTTPIYRESPRTINTARSPVTKSATQRGGSRVTGNFPESKVLQDVSALPKNNFQCSLSIFEQQRLKELEALRDCVIANEDEIKVLTPQGDSDQST